MKPDFKHVSMVVFCAFAAKLLISPEITLFSAFALLISASTVAFFEYKVSLSQIKHQNEKLELFAKRLEKAEEVSSGLKGEIASMRNAQGIQSLTGQTRR